MQGIQRGETLLILAAGPEGGSLLWPGAGWKVTAFAQGPT